MKFRWFALVPFILSSGIILVGAGHGVAPLWYIAMVGWEYWLLTAVFANIGYWSLIIGLFTSSNAKVSYPYFTTAGCSLVVAAICAAVKADQPMGTILSATPMVFFFLIYQIIAWSDDGR